MLEYVAQLLTQALGNSQLNYSGFLHFLTFSKFFQIPPIHSNFVFLGILKDH